MGRYLYIRHFRCLCLSVTKINFVDFIIYCVFVVQFVYCIFIIMCVGGTRVKLVKKIQHYSYMFVKDISYKLTSIRLWVFCVYINLTYMCYRLRRVAETGLLYRQRKLWHVSKPKCVRQIQPEDLNVCMQLYIYYFMFK